MSTDPVEHDLGGETMVMGRAQCPSCGDDWELTFVLGYDDTGSPVPYCSPDCRRVAR